MNSKAELFLTSSPFAGHGMPFSRENGFADLFRGSTKDISAALFITSAPDDPGFTDEFSAAVFETMRLTGIEPRDRYTLDGRNMAAARMLIDRCGLIILAGGHVPTQNAFFREIDLRGLLEGYGGVILGISAGSMNSAETVYAQPELEGEATDPDYERFLPGLALTRRMLLPHYNTVKDDVLDGLRVMEDITYPDSMGREFYAIPDGSYLRSRDGRETLFGEAYLVRDGVCRQICRSGERFAL